MEKKKVAYINYRIEYDDSDATIKGIAHLAADILDNIKDAGFDVKAMEVSVHNEKYD